MQEGDATINRAFRLPQPSLSGMGSRPLAKGDWRPRLSYSFSILLPGDS